MSLEMAQRFRQESTQPVSREMVPVVCNNQQMNLQDFFGGNDAF
jgi:hypothetical protein